jgi:chromosome transmission fidelity protein 18
MYAKALMPLREIALAIKIGESHPDKLIQRLRYICKEEKVSVEDQIIKELAEETNFDARSCINTLQFMASA